MIRDIVKENEDISINHKDISILKEYFPECFKDNGTFDIEKLASRVSDEVDIVREGYELKFLGKSYAKLLTATETTTVIEPNVEHNEKEENKNSKNIYISGDNLDGLKQLLKSYSGAVKCIYIDPPYNTDNDKFIYNDKFEFTVDELVEKLSIDEVQAHRIIDMTNRGDSSHSAWLTFMYPRLFLARDLLAHDGIIFISIDDNEQSNLKLLCDDIFGEENFLSQVIVQSNKRGQTYKQLAKTHEYILIYTKNVDTLLNELLKDIGDFKYTDNISEYSVRELRNRNPKFGKFNRPNLYYPIYINPEMEDKDGFFPVSLNKDKAGYSVEVYPLNSEGIESCWRWGKNKFENNVNENTLDSNLVGKLKTTGEYGVYEKYRKNTYKAKTIWFEETFGDEVLSEEGDIWDEKDVITEKGSLELGVLDMSETFDYPKPTYLVEKVLAIGAEKNSIIVDFFSGSGTTANAVMSINAKDQGCRNYITIQIPEDLDTKLENSLELDKPKVRKTIEFLDSVNRPHTLDQVGIERIIRSARRIKEDTGAEIDYGFKHYKLHEPEDRTLDKIEKFDASLIEFDKTILDDFGYQTIITTWVVQDGYGFNAKINEIDLGGYIAYICDKHIYLVNSGITDKNIINLMEKFENEGEFNPDNIVLFGYSFIRWTQIETLKNNIKQLNNSDKNLKVNIITRY